jgi:hypothetical protein
MTAGRNSVAFGIVELALAFHRAPTQYADLLHGRAPLPAGVDTLLKLAGGSEPDPDCAALAHPDELKAAALFFIEQVLFRHGANHYRVLGLEPGASPEQVKEHHRLLMRVFHPDRENRADDWKDAFATHINLAYTSLRDPEARRRYDATLKQAARPATPPHPARRATHAPRPAVPQSRHGGLPPIVLRYLPQWVLAGSALVAFAVVGAVYLNNPPAPMVAEENPARLAAPLHEASEAPAPAAETETAIAAAEKPKSPPATEARTKPPAHSPAPKPVAVPALAQVQAPAPAVAPVRVAARALPNETPAQPPGPRPPAAPAATEQAADEGPANRVARIAPLLTRELPPLPSAPPEPRAAVPARSAEPDPNATLAQFMASFERGDTQAFMALFDEVAIGSVGGKSQIRRQHDSLFRSTDLRHLDIEGMAWSQEGNWFRGEGRYRKTLMPKGELRLQTETGVFRIQLLRRGEQALIMGFDYLPGGRS